MPNYVTETVTTETNGTKHVVNTPVETKTTNIETIQSVIYFIFGAVDILLVARLLLKILGANTVSDFVKFIYDITNVFISPFNGIFRVGTTTGLETTSILEPSVIIAIIVYIFIAFGIVQLVQVLSRRQETV